MKIALLAALLGLTLVTCAQEVRNEPSDTASTLRDILPTLDSEWVSDTNNGRFQESKARATASMENKFTRDGRTALFTAQLLNDRDTSDMREFAKRLEESMASVPGQFAPTDGGSIALLEYHCDWVIIEYRGLRNSTFKVSCMHRAMPYALVAEASEEDHAEITNALSKTFGRLPSSGFRPVRPRIDTTTLRFTNCTSAPPVYVVHPVGAPDITDAATTFTRYVEAVQAQNRTNIEACVDLELFKQRGEDWWRDTDNLAKAARRIESVSKLYIRCDRTESNSIHLVIAQFDDPLDNEKSHQAAVTLTLATNQWVIQKFH